MIETLIVLGVTWFILLRLPPKKTATKGRHVA